MLLCGVENFGDIVWLMFCWVCVVCVGWYFLLVFMFLECFMFYVCLLLFFYCLGICVCGWVVVILLLGVVISIGVVFVVGLFDFSYCLLVGKGEVNLQQQYGGKVLLVVNIVSKCGFMFQYEGLEVFQKKYVVCGFLVFGFLFNDFKGQELGDEVQIQEFCMLIYGVKFLMFQKVQVIGIGVILLYQCLIQVIGVVLGWNFYKYLIVCDGWVVVQFFSKVKLDDVVLVVVIECELLVGKVVC